MNILVRGTNWIGDAVMTIPAVRKLRTLFPDAKLTLQTRELGKAIFQQTDLFDEIIAADGIVDQIRSLRKRRLDLAIVFPNSFSSAFAVWAGGAKWRFGYDAERRSLLLTDPIKTPDWKDSRHEIYYYLELIDAVEKRFFGKTTETADLEPHIRASSNQLARANEIIAEHRVNSGRKTIALAPGSTNSRAKRWTPERFAQLNDRLQSELGCNVLLLGSRGDKEVSANVAALSRTPPVDLTGATDIESVTGILSGIDLLISNDMGLAHLAPAVGTKTIVIFGPTNQLTTRPFSESASIVSANVECAPCMLRDCPIDHRCMTRISVDEVFMRAASVLSE